MNLPEMHPFKMSVWTVVHLTVQQIGIHGRIGISSQRTEIRSHSLKRQIIFQTCNLWVYAPLFYAPNCINAPQKVNLKKMHPAAF